MKTELTALITLAAALLPPPGRAEGVKVEHLGVNNTLVRVEGDARYVILPVQESNDDARINVLVDGHTAQTIYVRLAKSKTDYTVPFDLTPYRGHEVILDVVTPQGRSSVREAKEDVCWQGITLADSFDTTDREERYRPAYHHTPLYGWMNDPNGMVYDKGTWHLYYQWNPYGSKWQNMTWGHSTSRDLVHWEHHPAAIEPNGLGTVFSGSAAIDSTGSVGFGKDAVVALYTSAGTSQMQSLAWSTDGGETFAIYKGNPVLTLESEARDPNMFFDKTTGLWHLVLAHALDHEMLFFTSADMKEWTLTGSFGKTGAQDGVWECPDLFRLPVEGEDGEKWVLLCNINPGGPFGGSATQYFIGDFDGKTFRTDLSADGSTATRWLDYGKDHYATVSWSDAPEGRRTVIGWMSNWQYAAEVPTQQFRSANTLPRELSLCRGADGELYVASAPSPELEALRGAAVAKASKAGIDRKGRSYALPADGICEICLTLDARTAPKVALTLANGAGEKAVAVYDAATRTMSFDRRESGLTDFSDAFAAVTVAPTREDSGKVRLRIFVDRSSVELFVDGGRFAMTNLVFPTEAYKRLSISAPDGGKAQVNDLVIYSIKH